MDQGSELGLVRGNLLFIREAAAALHAVTFSPRRSAWIKKGAPKKPEINPFPDPVGHFEATWLQVLIFEVLIEGRMESKNLFSQG